MPLWYAVFPIGVLLIVPVGLYLRARYWALPIFKELHAGLNRRRN